MSMLAQIVIALVIFAGGFAGGIKWHVGVVAQRDLQDAELRQSDQRQQRQLGDAASSRHATTVATINHQLGDARATIATLSARQCLDAGTVRLLNDIGDQPMRAAAGQSASAAPAAAADPDDSRRPGASARDIAAAVATCRARYAELMSQINQILDIEDRRHPAPP